MVPPPPVLYLDRKPAQQRDHDQSTEPQTEPKQVPTSSEERSPTQHSYKHPLSAAPSGNPAANLRANFTQTAYKLIVLMHRMCTWRMPSLPNAEAVDALPNLLRCRPPTVAASDSTPAWDPSPNPSSPSGCSDPVDPALRHHSRSPPVALHPVPVAGTRCRLSGRSPPEKTPPRHRLDRSAKDSIHCLHRATAHRLASRMQHRRLAAAGRPPPAHPSQFHHRQTAVSPSPNHAPSLHLPNTGPISIQHFSQLSRP